MRIYIVSADSNGAYVGSSYTTEEFRLEVETWIAVFHQKVQAQAYVSYLNATFSAEQLSSWAPRA